MLTSWPALRLTREAQSTSVWRLSLAGVIVTHLEACPPSHWSSISAIDVAVLRRSARAASVALVQPLAAYLRAQPQALVADSGATSRCHGGDLVAALAAEAAPFRAVLVVHLLDDRNGRADPPAGSSQRLVRSADAPVTDEYARTGDEGFNLLLLLPAERARWALSPAGAVSPPATASPGRFHNLMHALMAQAKGSCDLAERCARELEPTHCAVELCACNVRGLFGVDDAGFGCSGLIQQIGIERHVSTVPRHMTAASETTSSLLLVVGPLSSAS